MRQLWLREVARSAPFVAGACLCILALQVCFADAPVFVTVDDYARAERFLIWNKDRYVTNADIQHHWVGKQDRFWYLRTNAAGEKEFIVVDAVSGKQTRAFEQKKVADALSTATGATVAAGQLPFSSFRFAENETAILFQFKEKLWTCRLDTSGCGAVPMPAAAHEVISPDGKSIAFLKDNNVWIRAAAGGAEFALTTDGVEHYGYAGSPGYSTHPVSDIRYHRLRPPQVIWSPDSRFLLSYRLDERQVKELFLLQSVPEENGPRPKLYTYRYAMAGDEHLPVVEPIVFDVVARRKVSIATAPLICLPQTLIEKREAWWSADGRTIYYLNRDRYSKSVSLHRANPITGAVTNILKETSDTVVQTNANNVFDYPLARTLRNSDVIWYSQRDGWGHLYYYGASGMLRNRITQGDWAVRGVVRIDEDNETIYFMASGREGGRDPYEQRLYSIQFDGTRLRLLTPEEADHKWPHVPFKPSPDDVLSTEAEKSQFSFSGRYFVDSYSRPDQPPFLVLRASDGRLIRQLEQADISRLREGGNTPIEPFQTLAADGRTPIYGNLFRPSTFDPNRKYPVIDANYPGPQVIRTGKSFTAATFNVFEAQSLAELGFIVITIDGRGTPSRSKAFLDHSYGRLDKASDLEDHIAGIRQLAQRYPYLDLHRVGIDGVSGGGFRAAQAILAYPEFYKVAVSAQGNHDQSGYLAPWGETFNGPMELCDYSVSSTPPLAANLEGKLLLMHGEMDDNVSPALTMKLVDALIRANKDFDLLVIPNGDHSSYFKSPYFIRRKWDYFVRNLLGTEPPANYAIQSQ